MFFQNLGEQAGGYHVHLYPVPYEFTTETDLCGADTTGGHFNPFNAGTTGPTQDELEVNFKLYSDVFRIGGAIEINNKHIIKKYK